MKRDVIYIDTLAVNENDRNQGIGHQLLNYVKEIKKKRRKWIVLNFKSMQQIIKLTKCIKNMVLQ